MHTVHVRVNDQATGQPTPVRFRITDRNGDYLAPFGRLLKFATTKYDDVGGNLLLGTRCFCYIDGACEIKLPPGELHVEIHKGPEYRPLMEEIQLGEGKIALRFAIERWTDLRKEGWYSGDVRAHAMMPHAALLEGMAEDLAVVNLLALEELFGVAYLSNILAFSGQQTALEAPGHLVAVNTLNRHRDLGNLGLLHSHRAVYPLVFGGRGRQDDWTMADWCDQCHRKGGLVVWAHTEHEAENFRFGEPLADLLLGKVDAFEVTFFEDSPFDVMPDWYRLQAAGVRVPLVGASGKERNLTALGAMRTYARLAAGEEFSYRAWIEAVRAGRTFITNGPLLEFRVNGSDPGAQLDIEAGTPVRIEATARGIVPFERLEILANGEVIQEAASSGDPSMARIEFEWTPTTSAWLAARCRGSARLPQYPAPQCVFAHASPVYVRVAGAALPVSARACAEFIKSLDTMLEWVRTEANCPGDKERQDLLNVFEQARTKLQEAARDGIQ